MKWGQLQLLCLMVVLHLNFEFALQSEAERRHENLNLAVANCEYATLKDFARGGEDLEITYRVRQPPRGNCLALE